MPKTVILRARAQADVEQAIDHYVNGAGSEVALNFIGALEQAYALISETPSIGSPRWSIELNLSGLRSTRLKGSPWLVFYVEHETHLDVWRVLHSSRDMPTSVNAADDV